VYKGMASSYIEMYDFDKSIDAANHAIDIDRSVPGVHQLKARALLAKARGERKAPDPTPTGQSASVAAQASGSSTPSQANGAVVAAATDDAATEKDESEKKVAAKPFTRAAKAAAEKLALEQKVAAAAATVTMRRSKRLKTAHAPNVAASPASSSSPSSSAPKTGQKPDPPGENLSEKASAGTAGAAARMPLSPQEIDALQKEALLAVTLGVLYESPWDSKQQSSNLEMYHKLRSQFEDRKRAPVAKRPL
jgi:hypothetical protein